MALVSAAFFATGCGGGDSAPPPTPGAHAASTARTGLAKAGRTPPAASTGSRTAPATGSAATTGRTTVSAADAICARRNGELTAILTSNESLPALAAAARKRARVEARAIGELERLAPPPPLAVRFRRVATLERASLRRVLELARRAQARDRAGVRAVEEKAGAGKLRLLAAAARARLRDCSGVPGLD